jgi:hypothetical protein
MPTVQSYGKYEVKKPHNIVCFWIKIIKTIRSGSEYYLTLIRMTKDEKGLAFFKGLLL